MPASIDCHGSPKVGHTVVLWHVLHLSQDGQRQTVLAVKRQLKTEGECFRSYGWLAVVRQESAKRKNSYHLQCSVEVFVQIHKEIGHNVVLGPGKASLAPLQFRVPLLPQNTLPSGRVIGLLLEL